MSNIGEKIRILRKFKSWTQKDLADILNVSESTIQKWEVEKNKLSIADVKRLSKVFGVNPNVIFDDCYLIRISVENNKPNLEIIVDSLGESNNNEKIKLSSNSILYRYVSEIGNECSAIYVNGTLCMSCLRKYENIIIDAWNHSK
jgi:transcriptional regulator with XRE-family HTH domain